MYSKIPSNRRRARRPFPCKASLLPSHPEIIPDLDLCPYDPWDLDGKAMAEGEKWYYFSRRSQNRVTANGYWESCGGDEQIMSSNGSKGIGVKKYYVFHIGEAPQGMKTGWIMQEFRVCEGVNSSRSRRRGNSKIKYDDEGNGDDDGMELSCLDELFLSLDDFSDISFPN
ncbi:hypothetical protein L1987_40545 [Smallanthus sonchifolius]|uniref:Uncharacterized protein n=1 Tax=Smallanthus sonchifolius TaxID=185202 RepID=A0ACB9GU32_9ASTR|nr:hypothetical protein L1987_40545 [Smallanthus sonchifolius]